MTKYIPSQSGEIIKIGEQTRTWCTIDVLQEVLDDDLIIQNLKPGHHILMPKATKNIDKFLELLDKKITKKLEFEKVILPKIVPLTTLKKAGVLGNWDNYLLIVTPLSKTKGITETYVLDPLQCLSFYQYFENKIINTKKGPIKWCDYSGPTYRNEDFKRLKPLTRQREFHRAEFIYIGTKEQVIKTREQCVLQLESVCKELHFQYRIVVGSGCYELTGNEPAPTSLEEIPIKDIEVYIPQTKSWLELAGCSVLETNLTSRFNIQSETGEKLWSGCTGIGLERLTYSTIANNKKPE